MADFMSLFLPPFLSPSTPALAPSPLTSSQFLHPHNQALSSKASALGSDLARAGGKHDPRKCRGGPRCHPLALTMLSVLPSSGREALPQLVWLALLWVTMPYPTPVPKQVRVSRTGAEQESIHSWRLWLPPCAQCKHRVRLPGVACSGTSSRSQNLNTSLITSC